MAVMIGGVCSGGHLKVFRVMKVRIGASCVVFQCVEYSLWILSLLGDSDMRTL